jgi:hypothetical protein
MSTPATLQWHTGHGGRRFATASIGGRPAVVEITRGPQGRYRIEPTVFVGSTKDHVSAFGNDLVEELAQAWLDRVGGQAT